MRPVPATEKFNRVLSYTMNNREAVNRLPLQRALPSALQNGAFADRAETLNAEQRKVHLTFNEESSAAVRGNRSGGLFINATNSK